MILIYYHCEEVEKYLMQYYEQTGFEYHKRRVEYDENNIVQNVLINVPKQLNTNQER